MLHYVHGLSFLNFTLVRALFGWFQTPKSLCDPLLQQTQVKSNWQLISASQTYKFLERKAYTNPQDKLTGQAVFGLM